MLQLYVHSSSSSTCMFTDSDCSPDTGLSTTLHPVYQWNEITTGPSLTRYYLSGGLFSTQQWYTTWQWHVKNSCGGSSAPGAAAVVGILHT